MKKIIFSCATALFLFSCAEKNTKKEVTEPMQEAAASAADKNIYKDVVFDSKKDLACGMPVTAGVSDTAHYDNKVYGFCSPECKAEFEKNPAGLISAK